MDPHRHVWNEIADHWDAAIGEGNDFQKTLIIPATDRLLSPAPGERILDACCGNGNYARRLSRNGCEVLAFDGSSRFVELARARPAQPPGSVSYHVADACDPEELARLLPAACVDKAVSSMAVMDLPTLEPLMTAVRRALRPGGVFVVSVGHPSFHSNEPLKTAFQSDGGEDGGEPSQSFGCLVTRYLTDWPHPSRGLLDQPKPHMMYHRSLASLLAPCLAAGFVVDGLEEPAFPPDTRLRSPFTWARRPEIPPALVLRLR
jgi:SAM-dependent methyltransferase